MQPSIPSLLAIHAAKHTLSSGYAQPSQPFLLAIHAAKHVLSSGCKQPSLPFHLAVHNPAYPLLWPYTAQSALSSS
jgi:hypothetical protein